MNESKITAFTATVMCDVLAMFLFLLLLLTFINQGVFQWDLKPLFQGSFGQESKQQ